jgi:pimeloyl-ACP methyl ester carboxylesterase
MRAVGSVRAVLFGYSEGAPMSILFAATYPEQVSALILGSAAARWFPAANIPGARYFEQPGDHSLRFAGGGDNDTLFREVATFLARV